MQAERGREDRAIPQLQAWRHKVQSHVCASFPRLSWKSELSNFIWFSPSVFYGQLHAIRLQIKIKCDLKVKDRGSEIRKHHHSIGCNQRGSRTKTIPADLTSLFLSSSLWNTILIYIFAPGGCVQTTSRFKDFCAAAHPEMRAPRESLSAWKSRDVSLPLDITHHIQGVERLNCYNIVCVVPERRRWWCCCISSSQHNQMWLGIFWSETLWDILRNRALLCKFESKQSDRCR